MNREQIIKGVKELRKRGLSDGTSLGYHAGWCDEVADIIEELAEENERLRASSVDYRNIPCFVADAKADTARNIFAEIDKFGKRPIPEASPVYILKQSDMDEIRNKHIPRGTPQDTCISCGEVIPEGRQVCLTCEKIRKRERKNAVN